MATQTGPRLRVEGSCEGCRHLQPERIHRGNLMPAWCAAVAAKGIPDGGRVTPAWCPELPAARLALGLLPPTFPARFAEALYASDDGKGSGALHALLAEVGGTPYDPENDPRYNGTGTATKKGSKR